MDIVSLALAKKGIQNSLAEAKEYTDAKTAGGLKYQGSKPTVADLPTPSESIKGHMYTIVENGHEYVCDGTQWVDLSADLVNKLNVLPKVDDPTDPGVGWPYHIPYRFDVKLDSEKANIDLYTITLDNTLTKMGFNKQLLGASTTTAGLMTAADKIRLDDNHSIELTGTSGEIQKSDAEKLVDDKLFYFVLEGKKFYFNKSTTQWSPRHGSVVKTNIYVNVEQNKLNLITVIVPIDSEEKASGNAQWGLSDINLQTTISDLETIRSGASAGATAYQKPSAGIPSTDMAESVQTSLDKADTALQEHQDISGKLNVLPLVEEGPGKGWPYHIPYDFDVVQESDNFKVTLKTLTLDNNVTKMNFDKNLPAATTELAGLMSAEDKTKLEGKQDKLTAGDNITITADNVISATGTLPSESSASEIMISNGTSWQRQGGYGYDVDTPDIYEWDGDVSGKQTVQTEYGYGVMCNIANPSELPTYEKIINHKYTYYINGEQTTQYWSKDNLWESSSHNVLYGSCISDKLYMIVVYNDDTLVEFFGTGKRFDKGIWFGSNNGDYVSSIESANLTTTKIDSRFIPKQVLPFPEAFVNNTTLNDFVDSINNYSGKEEGLVFWGQVKDGCSPWGSSGNADCKVEYIKDIFGDIHAILTAYSSTIGSTTFPNMWTYHTLQNVSEGESRLWRAVVTMSNQDAKIFQIVQGVSLPSELDKTYTLKLVAGKLSFVKDV